MKVTRARAPRFIIAFPGTIEDTQKKTRRGEKSNANYSSHAQLLAKTQTHNKKKKKIPDLKKRTVREGKK